MKIMFVSIKLSFSDALTYFYHVYLSRRYVKQGFSYMMQDEVLALHKMAARPDHEKPRDRASMYLIGDM